MKPYTLLLLGLLLASAAEAQTTDEARLEVTVTDAASGEALGYAVCSLRPKEGNGKERAAAADARGVCLLEGLKPGRFELRLLYMGHVFLQGELQLPAGLTRRRIQRAHVVVEDRPRSHRHLLPPQGSHRVHHRPRTAEGIRRPVPSGKRQAPLRIKI